LRGNLPAKGGGGDEPFLGVVDIETGISAGLVGSPHQLILQVEQVIFQLELE
jgi:hypothetical protein